MREDNLKHYDKAVDLCPRFERKGKTMPYTSANGYMFSLLNKDGDLGIRFDKAAQEQYMSDWNTGPLFSHGATMKGYVRLPEHVMKDPKTFAQLLNKSYDYVMSLKPK